MANPTTIGAAINILFPGNSGITNTKSAGNDSGIDVSLPANYQIRATAPGIFRQDLSTLYQQTYQLANGLFESYVHVVPPSTGNVPLARKGDIIGTIYAKAGPYSNGGITYHSTGPHTEIDFVRNPTGAGSFFTSATLDPTSILIQQAGGKSTPYTQPQSPSLFPNTPNSNDQNQNTAGDSWTLGQLGPFNLSIPKAPIEHLGIVIGIALFVLILLAVLGASLVKSGKQNVAA